MRGRVGWWGIGIPLGGVAVLVWMMGGGGSGLPQASPDTAVSVPASPGLPWEIESLPDGGTRVFGLQVGADRMSRARWLWPQGFLLAVLRGPGERWSLQAYSEAVTVGGLTGKLVLTADASPSQLQDWGGRSPQVQPTASGAWRHALRRDDEEQAWQLPLRRMVFGPSVRLEEAVVRARFGQPTGTWTGSDGVTHHVYRAVGVIVSMTPQGQALFHYVHPRDLPGLLQELGVPQARASAVLETP